MARVNMEEIIEALDNNFSRTLKAVIDEIYPENTFDERMIMRVFRTKVERGFERWEYVSDRCVDAE